MPSATTTSVWKRPHGRRSSRAGISVSMTAGTATASLRAEETASVIFASSECTTCASRPNPTCGAAPRSQCGSAQVELEQPDRVAPAFPKPPRNHKLLHNHNHRLPRSPAMSNTAWIVLGVIAVLVIGLIMIYNGLVAMRQRVNQSFADVDV